MCVCFSVNCEQKAIKDAYHVMCNNCAGEKNVCAKCLESREIVPTNIKTEKELIQEQVELERLLSGMTERERRSYLRQYVFMFCFIVYLRKGCVSNWGSN